MPSDYSGDLNNYPAIFSLLSDGDGPIQAADVRPALEGLIDTARNIVGRRLPYTVNGHRSRPTDAIVSVSNGNTLKVHTSSNSLFQNYAPNNITCLANLAIELRHADVAATSCDVILGVRANGVDEDKLEQRFEVPHTVPLIVSMSAWMVASAGLPINSYEVYVKVDNTVVGGGPSINVHNVSLTALLLRNAG